jgi:hypothetical protein
MLDGQHGRWRYSVAFGLVAGLVLGILLALPLSLDSILDDLLGSVDGAVAPLVVGPADGQPGGTGHLHITVIGLDEVQRRATLEVSGQHACGTACGHTDRLLFFALWPDHAAAAAGPPPSAAMDLPPTSLLVTQKLELPVRGEPNRYPFDGYELRLGISRVRVQPDGSLGPIPPEAAAEGLAVTVQERIARHRMAAPVALDPARLQGVAAPYPYLVVESLSFHRPLFVQVLAVLLVLLIGAAAAYAVFMRPLPELIMNAGGVILGVWGIRTILTPSNFVHLTSVDLSLSAVILFLLGAITVRMLMWCHEKAGRPLHFLPAGALATPAEGQENRCDHRGCPNSITARCGRCRGAFCPRHVSSGPTPECDGCAAHGRENGAAHPAHRGVERGATRRAARAGARSIAGTGGRQPMAAGAAFWLVASDALAQSYDPGVVLASRRIEELRHRYPGWEGT